MKTLSELIPGEVISIDGKTVKHSNSKGKDKKAIHIVNAWASEQRLVLGQIKVKNKSNEMQRGCADRRLRRLAKLSLCALFPELI